MIPRRTHIGWGIVCGCLGAAILVLSAAYYPYVYLLARTALGENASQLMEAARLLGAGQIGLAEGGAGHGARGISSGKS